MQFGYFTMPSHPPERCLDDGHDWDLQILRWADELGFSEAWIGEHHTAPWEPHPSPDLLVAQALMETRRIRIGPGGFLLPYHHPAELANRVAMLDHISQGRLNFGIAASGLPSDWAMFNVDGMSGQNREMTREALDIILKLWTARGAVRLRGQVLERRPARPDVRRACSPHIKPLQKPHPPIGVAGLSAVLRHAEARRRARLPPDEPQPQPGLCREPLGVGRGRRRRAGRTPSRARLAAWCARSSSPTPTRRPGGCRSARMMGRMMREYFLPLLGEFGFLAVPQARPDVRRQRRDAGILRPAQLARRLARDGDREDREDVRRGRRLRPPAAVLLRLRREPAGLAAFDGAAGEGGHAQGAHLKPKAAKKLAAE